MGPISVTIEGRGLQYVIWTDINNSICSPGSLSHTPCMAADWFHLTLHCIDWLGIWTQSGIQGTSDCQTAMHLPSTGDKVYDAGVWIRCLDQSLEWLTLEIRDAINPCQLVMHIAHCRHWNTNIPQSRCLLLVEDNTLGRLRVFKISSQVQTSFYQNQFELGGNNSRFSDSDQRGRGALTVTSNQQQDWPAQQQRAGCKYHQN